MIHSIALFWNRAEFCVKVQGAIEGTNGMLLKVKYDFTSDMFGETKGFASYRINTQTTKSEADKYLFQHVKQQLNKDWNTQVYSSRELLEWAYIGPCKTSYNFLSVHEYSASSKASSNSKS